MKKIILIAVAALCLGSYGCSKEKPLEFNSRDRLYFWHTDYKTLLDDLEQKDSIRYSFMDSGMEVVRDTIYVVVQVMGEVVPYDRYMDIRVVDTDWPNPAVAGKHYLDLGETRHLTYVPAGSEKGRVPVVLLRDSELKDTDARICLRIFENEYFGTGIPDYQDFKIVVNDSYIKPQYWDASWSNYFGMSWGQMKQWFLNTYVLGGFDINNDTVSDPNIRNYWSRKAKIELAAYNEANGTLTERDGTPVSFDE